jgi:hypothetical protein
MDTLEQVQQDLRFVKEAVARRDQTAQRPIAIYWVWAVYVLVGYTLIDFAPNVSGWFFMIGGIAGGVLSALLGKRAQHQLGEVDRDDAKRKGLHFMGGIVLAVLFSFALAAVSPPLRSTLVGQVLVIMIGLVYFLAGVHFDRNFLWLGPLVMAGGVLVGLVPRYGWTALGVVIALGLVVPTLLPARGAEAPAVSPSTDSNM